MLDKSSLMHLTFKKQLDPFRSSKVFNDKNNGRILTKLDSECVRTSRKQTTNKVFLQCITTIYNEHLHFRCQKGNLWRQPSSILKNSAIIIVPIGKHSKRTFDEKNECLNSWHEPTNEYHTNAHTSP